MINIRNDFPSLVKYMGSKTELINFIEHGINMIHREGQMICDLFAGSATLSGALRGECNIVSNDIQSYSQILSKAYLSNYNIEEYPSVEEIVRAVSYRVINFNERFDMFSDSFNYDREFTLEEFNQLESAQRELINFNDFGSFDNYFLFTKYYAGTYWSYDQCVWIDSIKYVADRYRDRESIYTVILAALMYAMAYNSQSTGHYAQYRDANTVKSMNDILIYRRKNIISLFERKMNELINWCEENNENEIITTTLDYAECLRSLDEGTLVYADPPYCFVHYSRFYHAIETLVKYDYPNVAHKGRYREDRHQSPFCIKTKVSGAFKEMFETIRNRNLELVLSYSNSDTNTISLIDLLTVAFATINNVNEEADLEGIKCNIEESIRANNIIEDEYIYDEINIINDNLRRYELNSPYEIRVVFADHIHSTMGRADDKIRQVKEILIIIKRRG